MSFIQVEQITVQIAKKTILKDISFVVDKGNSVAILGANGSGKSTLIRTMLKMQQPTSGQIQIQEKSISSYTVNELARKIAFLPQTAILLDEMSVDELVGFGRYPYQRWWQFSQKKDKMVIAECIRLTGLDSLRYRKVKFLSGGERQRVRIAMALAQEPEIIILDEPTTYLDLRHQIEVMELLQKINQKDGVTVLMVLHDINHAIRYASHLLVLSEKRVYAFGTPKEVVTPKMLCDVYGVNADLETRNGMPHCYINGIV